MSAPNAPRVPVRSLVEVTRDTFAAVGLPVPAAHEVAEALVLADQEGQPSHGVMMAELYVERIVAGSVATRTTAEIVADRGATAVLDAHNALGQLTARQAIDLACEKAATHGVGVVAVRNAFHFGTASRYVERAAGKGKVGVVMSNTRPLMPAPGGAERLVGNNPVAIALPTASGRPLSFDMATSQAAMGKIRLAAASDESIPDDWATDAAGAVTTDPKEAISGMLLPMGGAKGFGLALMIDLLSGLLSGGGWGDAVTPLFGDRSVPYNSSQLFIAIDPQFFGSGEDFAEGSERAAERVRNSPRATSAGAEPAVSHASGSAPHGSTPAGTPPPARAPGDARREARERNRETVPVAAAVLDRLLQTATTHGAATRRLEEYLTPAKS